ncbi:sodium-dependent glucose transporter 1-like isoform X2 [Amblyomma americanum]
MKDIEMSGGVSLRDFPHVRYQQPQPAPVRQSEHVVSTRTRSPRAELWLNIGRTCNVSLGNFGMGLMQALTGVALLDLGEIYNTSLSAVSQVLTTRCVGGLVGAFIGANVWILKIWPKNSSPALQVFHLAFGIGCLAAPVIARPFLSTQATTASINATVKMLNTTWNGTNYLPVQPPEYVNATVFDDARTDSTIYYAFGIASAFQFVIVLSMATLYFIDNTSFNMRRTNATNGVPKTLEESGEYIRFARILLALQSAFICVYVALEGTMSHMLTAFAVKCDLHFSKPLASRLVAVYFGSFAFSRLAAALVTVKLSAFSVLVVSQTLLVTTAAVLLAWGSSSTTALWACTALAGIAEGPQTAAVTTWVGKHINISNKMMSIAVVAGVLGSLLPPLLVGRFLDSRPNVFLYVFFTAVVLSLIFFISMCLYVRRKPLLHETKHLVTNASSDNPGQTNSVQAAEL